MRTTVAIGAIAMTSLAGAASPAGAGQYELHSCRLPDGTPIPAVGWLAGHGGGEWLRSDDTCERGGALTAGLMSRSGYEHPPGSYSRWRLAAPAGVSIRRMRGEAAFATDRGRDYGSPVVQAESDDGQGRFGIAYGAARGSFERWDAPGNAFDTGTMTPTRGFRVVPLCAGSEPCPDPGDGRADKALAQIFQAQTTLEDLSDPRVQAAEGRLLGSGTHRGVEHVRIEATDTGSGVYRVIVELDGREIVRQVIDDNAGQCADRDTGDGSERDFTSPVPCKLNVDGSEALDTRLLPDGEHTLRLLVEDAAGNRRLAAGPIEGWTVANRREPSPATGSPPASVPDGPNGVPASDGARLSLAFVAARARRRCRTRVDTSGRTRRRCRRVRGRPRRVRRPIVRTRYGARTRVAGRLVGPDGAPIRGAFVELHRARRGGGRRARRRTAVVRTDARGRFTATLRRSASERIHAAYRPTPSAAPAISRTLTRLVRAGVSVRASRRELSPGERVTLRAGLRGGARPRKGVRVAAEVRLRRGWAVFAERRIGRSGRLRASGRFHRRGLYALRVRVLRTRDYPYEPAVSRSIRVRVR